MNFDEFRKTIAKEIESAEIGRSLLEAFAQKHPIAIPSSMMTVYCWKEPQIQIGMRYCPNEEGRNKVLAFIGQAWGSDGWERSEGYSRRDFNWSKVLAGVRLILEGAEQIPAYKAPVPANAFPLMLPEYSEGVTEKEFGEVPIPF